MTPHPSHDAATPSVTPPPRWERLVTGLLVVVALLALGNLLGCCYNAFFSGKFYYNDYGRYTQMIRNCAFGRPFQYSPSESYLFIHLSFTLGLLGPLFRLWDHAFLLSLLQWLMLAGGGAILVADMRRLRLRGVLAAAILCFWTLYPFTQGVMLDEFHTVGLYFLLVPWLHHCIRFRRAWVWLPFALILGVREDAALFLLAPLLYYAWRERWRAGYAYAAIGLAYCLLAVFVLYPAINGASLFAWRANYIGASRNPAPLTARLLALALVAAPLAAGLPWRRYALSAALMLISGLLPAMLSSHPNQQVLRTIYAGPVMVWLPLVLIDAWRRESAATPLTPRYRPLLHAALLAAVTVSAHLWSGFVWLGRHHREPGYRTPSPFVRAAAAIGESLPRHLALLTNKKLVAVNSARAAVYDWEHFEPRLGHRYDAVLTGYDELTTRLDGALWRDLQAGRLEVLYADDLFVLLARQHRADAVAVSNLLARLACPPSVVLETAGEAGTTRLTEAGLARHWRGHRQGKAKVLSHGATRRLAAGRHRVTLDYHAHAPAGAHLGAAPGGHFTLHPAGGDTILARAPLTHLSPSVNGVSSATLELLLEEALEVEFRIVGAAAELWLYRVHWRASDVAFSGGACEANGRSE